MAMDERIRRLRMRGLKPFQIARDVGVEAGYVTAALRRFERDYRRQAELDTKAAAVTYRREMIERLESLKREAWEQVELAKESKKKTQQEMLKDTDGKVTHQRVKVDTLPGETSPSLLGEIRQIELLLGKLNGVEVDEQPTPLAPTIGDVIVLTPSQPIDLERIAKLNDYIRTRGGMNGKTTIDVPALAVGGNGKANGNGGAA
jgi:hypothetical protein